MNHFINYLRGTETTLRAALLAIQQNLTLFVDMARLYDPVTQMTYTQSLPSNRRSKISAATGCGEFKTEAISSSDPPVWVQ
jgi:hypothetical protein